jgi:hypothetical protein
MIEISSLTAMIAAEVLLGLLVLSGLLVLFTILRKQRIRKAASHLAERVQVDKEKRSERLKKLLEEHYQLQSPKLDQTLHGIMQTEMTLYQNMLNGFLKDDQLSLQQIDVDVENLVLSYQALAGDITVTGSSGGSDGGADSDDVEALKAENERLAEELKVTMDTMGRMLNEYSTMFADGEDGFPAEAVASANPESASAASESPVKDEAAAPAAAETAFSASGVDDEMVIPDMTEEELTESSLSELAEGGDEPEEVSASEAESEADLAQIEPQETELPESDITDVEIPDMEASNAEPADLSLMAEESLGVDEEVSEIIDEVMEIADDMMQDSAEAQAETDAASEALAEAADEAMTAEQAGESLVDDLSAIDIEIPEMESSEVEQAEFEPGSLEEEWAKLLEEESSDEEKKDA